MDLSTLFAIPFFQMTGEQIYHLFSHILGSKPQQPETITASDHSDGNKYAYGIQGICEIFGCSKPTAQRIKREGIIDGAITQYGRTIIIDREKALELARNARKKGGRGCK